MRKTDKDFPPLQGRDNVRESNQTADNQSTEPMMQSMFQPNAAVVADNSKDNSKDNDGWQQITNKNRKKKKLVIGQSTTHTSFTGIAKKSVVCVTRLMPGTSTDIVTDHLKTNSINVLSCFDVSRANENEELKFTSMRVCVYTMDVAKLYDCNLWPMGVVVRSWKFKSQS